MKTLFISANAEQTNMPVMPLGLACVAEAARSAGHDAAMLDLMFETNASAALAETLTTFQPECIGISVRNIDDQNMECARFLLDDLKETVAICRGLSGAPIVLGGAGYSIFPDSALDYLEADMGIAGEGEQTFPRLLSHLEQEKDLSEIPGLYIRGRGLQRPWTCSRNLDVFKMPDVGILSASAALNPDPWIPVQTRRGCGFNCSYCSTAIIEGIRFRRRSPEYVVTWLQDWVNAGYRNFFFVDNIFNFPADHARELCRLIIKRGLDIRWQGIIYPWHVDAALVRLMAEAGCMHISLGFESGHTSILRSMNKRFTLEEVRTIAGLFGEHNIERMGFLLLGAPGETKETVEESLAFADSLQLEMLSLTPGIRIYPNTPLAETARAEGVVSETDPLLKPRFYLANGLEDWLPKRLTEWTASRPNVMM